MDRGLAVPAARAAPRVVRVAGVRREPQAALQVKVKDGLLVVPAAAVQVDQEPACSEAEREAAVT